MKIYLDGKEINQQEFLDKMNEKLQKHYKMDYTKMESTINIDNVLKEFENSNIEDKQFYGQQCQDKNITMAFRKLHNEIVDRIIKFCNDYNIMIDEVTMKIYDIDESIPYHSWQAPTDSALTFMKFSDDYKSIMNCEKVVSKEEFEKIKMNQEPYLFSM